MGEKEDVGERTVRKKGTYSVKTSSRDRRETEACAYAENAVKSDIDGEYEEIRRTRKALRGFLL